MDHVEEGSKPKKPECRCFRDAIAFALDEIKEKKLDPHLAVLKVEEYVRDFMVRCIPQQEAKIQELMMQIWDKLF